VNRYPRKNLIAAAMLSTIEKLLVSTMRWTISFEKVSDHSIQLIFCSINPPDASTLSLASVSPGRSKRCRLRPENGLYTVRYGHLKFMVNVVVNRPYSQRVRTINE
jgi:hypothetical protein